MANVALRPGYGNFWGVFHVALTGGTCTGGYDATYETWAPSTDWDPLLPTYKGQGINTVSWLGSLKWLKSGLITQSQYIADLQHQMDTLLAKGMFALPVLSSYPNQYGFGDLIDNQGITQGQINTALAAIATMFAAYPNCIGLCICDEAVSPTITTNESTRLASAYAAVKAVTPSWLAVTATTSPGGTGYDPITNYTGQMQTNLDSIATLLDFFYFNQNQSTIPASSQITALAAAYPGKQFYFNSSYNVTGNWAGSAGMVGSNNVRGTGWFSNWDFNATPYGMYTNTGTARPANIATYLSGIKGPLPMALLTFTDRVRMLTSTTGTGTLTLTTAVAQYQAAPAAWDGLQVEYVILDVNGTAWETGIGGYTNSGTTLTRGAIASSNSNAAINISGANSTVIFGPVATVQSSNYAMQRSFIRGGALASASTTTISCTAVSAFIEASNQVFDFAAPSNLTITAGASTIGHVYLKKDGTIVDSTTGPVAFATAAGNARSKSGDTTQRYLGSYATDGSSHVIPFTMLDLGAGLGLVQFTSSGTGAAPYRVLSAGAATSFTSVSLSGLLPANVCTEYYANFTLTTTVGNPFGEVKLSIDGTNNNAGDFSGTNAPGGFITVSLWTSAVRASPSFYYQVNNAANAVYIDLLAYRFLR